MKISLRKTRRKMVFVAVACSVIGLTITGCNNPNQTPQQKLTNEVQSFVNQTQPFENDSVNVRNHFEGETIVMAQSGEIFPSQLQADIQQLTPMLQSLQNDRNKLDDSKYKTLAKDEDKIIKDFQGVVNAEQQILQSGAVTGGSQFEGMSIMANIMQFDKDNIKYLNDFLIQGKKYDAEFNKLGVKDPFANEIT